MPDASPAPAPPTEPSSLPAAVPVRRRRLPFVWLLPIIGLGVVAYFAYWAYTQNQPNVELQLADASGIKAFQTPVLCRGVEVGTVTDVTLDPTGNDATVSIRLDESGLPLATADAEWWVNRPEFSLTDVSGIESLLAGPSIEYRPGNEAPTRKKIFNALSGPPPEAGMSGGLRLFLTADARDAIEPGTPVRFRGIPIGRVISMRLPTHGQSVIFIAEIDLPYTHLIRENSIFWHKKRVIAHINSVALGLDGFQIDLPRLNTAIDISIDVATPDKPGPPINADAVFEMQAESPDKLASWKPDLTIRESSQTSADERVDETADDPDEPQEEKKADPIGDLFHFINPFD